MNLGRAKRVEEWAEVLFSVCLWQDPHAAFFSILGLRGWFPGRSRPLPSETPTAPGLEPSQFPQSAVGPPAGGKALVFPCRKTVLECQRGERWTLGEGLGKRKELSRKKA